jgi:gliding motility-associated protein GldE
VTIGFIVIVVLLLFSAFISASEVAYFTLKESDLQRIEKSTSPAEQTIWNLLQRPHELLATISLLSTIINIGIIMISIAIIGSVNSLQSSSELIFTSGALVITIALSFLLGIVPKAYASNKSLKFVSRFFFIWKLLLSSFRPLSKLIVQSWKNSERIALEKAPTSSVDKLNEALELAAESEESTKDEREILKGIVNFGTLVVRQVMRSRVDVHAVDIEVNFHELMDYINKSGFSRIPVYRNTIDKIEGVLYIKDLLPFIDNDETFKWQQLIRPGLFVPDNKKIDNLLKDFQRKHVHIAIVVDEYGGTLGLITLEDIIEEIIGDINDEFDEETKIFKQIDEHTFVFEGKTSLHDVCKNLDIDSDIFDKVRGESDSLGGLILELNNELPGVDKKISFEQFTFVIEAVDKRRIKRVRVHINEQKES